MKACSSLEALEGRIAPATLVITGTAGDDLLNVIATSADTGTYQLNDGPIVPFSEVTKFEFGGGDGDDTLTIVNPDGSVFAPADGIVYDGQGHRTATGDTLVLSGGGGTGFGETWILGASPDSGTIIFSDGILSQVVSYSGLEPLLDTVPAATLTITGTNASNAISYTVGSQVNRGLIAVDNNETIEFANKTTLIINALGGDDTITLNNPNVPTGLTTINVDAGEGVDRIVVETSGGADIAVFTPTSANSATLALPNLALSSTFTRVENVVYRNTDPVGLDNLTINGAFNDTTDYDAATFSGSFRSLPSPAFDFSLVGRLTVNAGTGDFDVVNITGSSGADLVTAIASAITVITPGSTAIVTLGATIDQVNLSTLDGNDNIDLDLNVIGLRKRVDGGAGNDTVNLLGTTDATIFGGDGDDVLMGTSTADLILGGAGNDVLIGGQGADTLFGEEGNDRFGEPAARDVAANDSGNDTFFGGAGSDIFFWDPGDGDDVIEGGAGDSDQLFFSGNAGAEQFFLFADVVNPSRFHLFRVQAAIDIDAGDLEEVNLNTLGGTDTVTVGRSDIGVLADLSSTTIRAVDVALGTDSAEDSVTFEGRPSEDNLLVSVASASVKVAGGSYDLRIDGSDPSQDRLTVNANEGDDTIVAEAGVRAVIAITLSGGTGNDFLSADGILNGNEGDDTLIGGAGNNTFDGGAGADTFRGKGGTDAIGGGAGDSFGDLILVEGTEVNDVIVLADNGSGHLLATVNGLTTTYTNFVGGPLNTAGIDRVDVFALGGNDRVDLSAYTATPTRVLGGDGDDLLIGSPQDDLLDGGTGRDVLQGGGGENTLLNQGAFGFTSPTAYDVGKQPKGVVLGDFNGDGVDDLAAVNSGINTVSVLLGTPAGRYQDPVDFSTGGKKPASVAVGDFNLDGKIDLAVANTATKNIGILLGDGTGTFAAATLFSSGKSAGDLHVADLDNDMKLDLVFIAGTGVGRLIGAGDGTFGSLATFATTGAKPIALAVGDFNRDTFADIATANNGSANVSLLTGTGTGFNPAVKFKVGLKPSAIGAGDFDGDGNLDLAVTNAGNRFISLLFGNGSVAGPQFDRQIKIVAPGLTSPTALAIADINRDGVLDLIASNSKTGSLAILLGLGRGLFNAPIALSLGGDPKMKPGAIAIGDANGDGAPDLAIVGTGSADVTIALTLAG